MSTLYGRAGREARGAPPDELKQVVRRRDAREQPAGRHHVRARARSGLACRRVTSRRGVRVAPRLRGAQAREEDVMVKVPRLSQRVQRQALRAGGV